MSGMSLRVDFYCPPSTQQATRETFHFYILGTVTTSEAEAAEAGDQYANKPWPKLPESGH